MSEQIKMYLDFIVATGLDPLLLLLFGSVIFLGWHYITKIYPRIMAQKSLLQKRKIKVDEERLAELKHNNEFLREASIRHENASARQFEILNNNTAIMKHISDSLNEVKERVASNNDKISRVENKVDGIGRDCPNIAPIDKIYNKLDNVQNNVTTKNDVTTIMTALNTIDKKTSKANEILSELKGRK